jgi:hypothetical protein
MGAARAAVGAAAHTAVLPSAKRLPSYSRRRPWLLAPGTPAA